MSITKVKFKDQEVNPFHGMYGTLNLYQKCSKGQVPSMGELEKAWEEGTNPEKKAMVFIVLFFAGDITGRAHNMLKGNVDKGGNAEREVFRDVLIPFLVSKMKKESFTKKRQLMYLIMEYTVLDNIVAARVKTKKKTQKVEQVINMIEVFGVQDVAKFCSFLIQKGTDFQKTCLAKFLTRPRLTKRSKSTKMLPETRQVMMSRYKLIESLSKLQNWLVEEKSNGDDNKFIVFTGFNTWRATYNGEFESKLFSSGNILKYDETQFHAWLEQLPSDARFRVRNRVCFDEEKKWGKLGTWYSNWEKFKEKAQTEQRELEAELTTRGITKDNMDDTTAAKLEELKAKAKVNSGAVNFSKMFDQIVQGTVDKIKIQPFLDKVNLPYNTLVFVDDSGSMNTGWGFRGNFTARQFGAFMATICLSKNPDPEARNMMGLFSANLRMFNGITSTTVSQNAIMRGQTKTHPMIPLIDDKAHFLDNQAKMQRFLRDNQVGRMTNVASIPNDLNRWVAGDSQRLEEIQRFPVWTLISDGNFNQLNNATTSALDFMQKCENYFGFRPYVILIDVGGNNSTEIQNITGVENMIMVPPNPMSIELILTHFKDMHTFDVFTPLRSLYESHRYSPVKDFAEKL